jgi:hypothetical protein
MRKVYRAGPITVTLDLPDAWPEGVDLGFDLDPHPDTPEQAEAVIEAMGGLDAFEPPDDIDRSYYTLKLAGVPKHGRDEESGTIGFEVWLPSGKAREPRPLPPFVGEVYERLEEADTQARAYIREKVAEDGSYSEETVEKVVEELRRRGVKAGDPIGGELIVSVLP